MRNELDNIERIENYLTGQLSEAETAAFESEMNTNVELRKQVELQRDLMEGITRKSLIQDAQRAHRKHKLGKNGLNWGLGGFAILVVAAAAWFFTTQLSSETSENLRYKMNEMGTEQFADADRFLPSQLFEIDGGKDTLIQTEGGISMTILANTFLDEDGNPVKGNIDLEVKEALDPLSIIKAGLTTMSGDRLLESGGMFYVNGRQGKTSLQIDPNQGVYTQVPTDKKNAKMQLFDGKRMADGSINWENPKPLESFLTPVEITTLDFYPPDYLDELGNRGYDKTDKRFSDSLYYSYADMFGDVEIEGEIKIVESDIWFESDSMNGEVLFKQNCRSCHHPEKTLIGPGLVGVRSKWNRNIEHSIYDWMRNPTGYMRDHPDKYFESIASFSPTAMTGFNLTNEEFDAILDYVDNYPVAEQATEVTAADEFVYGINPASIKTIWNAKYNNTNLATKEFEERVAEIHGTCDQWILDYYVNNLDKRLCTLDSAVAQRRNSASRDYLYGDYAIEDTTPISYPVPEEDKFWEFARRGDGRVETNNQYAEFLKGYYHRQAKIEAEAIQLVRKQYDAENLKKLREAQEERNGHASAEAQRYLRNWNEEYQTNLKEAYRQLGYKPTTVRPTNNVVVSSSGWKNVDQYVAESVTNRTTLDYKDQYGNRAVIKYEPISLEVANAAEFDRVLVYMLPNDLYSFQRMTQNGNSYSEKLNELFEYDVMCIGFKGEDSFIHHIKTAKPKDYGQVKLNRIGKMELEKKLYAIKDYSVQRNLKEDIAFQKFDIKEQKRVETRMKKEQLRNEMHAVVFPCSPQIFPAQGSGEVMTFE